MTGLEALAILEHRLRELLAALRDDAGKLEPTEFDRGFAAGVEYALNAIEVDLLGVAGEGTGE